MAPVVGLVGLGLIQRGFPAVGVAQISICFCYDHFSKALQNDLI